MPNTNDSTSECAEFYRARLRHPLIDALRPLPAVFTMMAKELEYLPTPPNDEVRSMPPNDRYRLTTILYEIHIPLERDVALAYQIDDMIRTGLEARPLVPQHYALSKERIATLVNNVGNTATLPESLGPCGSLISRSGEGKSRACRRCLMRYQIVVHHDSRANPLLPPKQIVAIIAECPSDRTIPSLVIRIVKAIESVIGEKLPARFTQGNRSTLISNVAELCETYWIGLIIIDECQHALRNGAPEGLLMNFLVEMSNTLRIPILYVGTPAALNSIGGQLRQARRMIGAEWKPFQSDDPQWHRFLDHLWKYQFTKTFTPLDDDLRSAIFEYTQGIPFFAVVLYGWAQRYAIGAAQEESITVARLKAVYDDLFGPVKPMLEALKSGDPGRIAQFEDLAHQDQTQTWFEALSKLREDLRIKAARKIINAHKRRTKEMVKSAEADATAFAKAGTNAASSDETFLRLLMVAKQLGLDPAEIMKEMLAKARTHPK
jgi:hypothetical protein